MERTKKQKQAIWTVGTVVFLMVSFLVGIVAQSNYRTKQKSELVGAVYSSVKAIGFDETNLISVLTSYQTNIDYAADHKPIFNFQLSSVPADAAYPVNDLEKGSANWCELIERVANNTSQTPITTNYDQVAVSKNAAELFQMSGCKSK